MVEVNTEIVLDSVNRRLSEMLRLDPPALATGGVQSLSDYLWVWGILGGKDVGKSSLINALAGAEVVDRGSKVGEGTFCPSAYLTAADEPALRARFAGLTAVSIAYHPSAPQSMKGLVLIDLPDFDSLYADHIEQVRRVAAVLDGIIWVTTPKKVGDLRGLNEIQRVLKARTNFVYVVNKMDWLLGQSDRPPLQELDRAVQALHAQITANDPTDGEGRSFLISARYRSRDDMVDAIARSRNQPQAEVVADGNGSMLEAVRRLLGDFDLLKRTLTTAPTSQAIAANKRANLEYQVRTQAVQLLRHYQPREALQRLERVAGPEAVEEAVAVSFSDAYCRGILERLNSERTWFAEWSGLLFRQRIAQWPLLGLVAWPIALLGTLLGGLRSLAGGSTKAALGDPFRQDGISLEERIQSVMDRMRGQLAGIARQIDIALPEDDSVCRQFRSEALLLAEEHRSVVLAPFLRKPSTLVGRGFRWFLPLAALVWFPFLQPVLAGLLEAWSGHGQGGASTLFLMVEALSAGNVLVGLGVSVLILAVLVAAVYSGSVRDSFVAMERLRSASPEIITEPLTSSLVHTIRRPIEDLSSQLATATTTLERLAGD